MGLTFEWDAAKAQRNLSKHGVAFGADRFVFHDPFHVERCDPRIFHEDRCLIVGIARGKALSVVYTTRDKTLRIISAREATRHEINAYWKARHEHAPSR